MAELLRGVADSPMWVPSTFALRPGGKDERAAFLDTWKTSPRSALWIVKPSSGSKGEGILITKSHRAAMEYVDSQPNPFPWVAQRYIQSPFLINGRKADIRSWVLLTHDLSVYVYRKGVLRTASTLYKPEEYSNDLGHLTNHCIQQNAPDYGRHEKGNEMWYEDFRWYLKEATNGKMDFDRDIVPQMDYITGTVLREALRKISRPPTPLRSFQLFGFDFILDDAFTVWLLEINGSPMIAEDLRTQMVTDLIDLSITKHFLANPPAVPAKNQFHCIYTHRY
eukprot:TRINITY_DN46511_c0_g1_i1.p1 TRINITY_DN46511_c0_g1~~TRINITY_DN46511_c0_g1_i1.p1  ORF type:complete len:296 (+),score=30.38 TRINITY_DN46511_c0_g1_i1:50-889(+)